MRLRLQRVVLAPLLQQGRSLPQELILPQGRAQPRARVALLGALLAGVQVAGPAFPNGPHPTLPLAAVPFLRRHVGAG